MVRALACYVAALLILLLMACSKSTEPTQDWEPLLLEELTKEAIPPCLSFGAIQAVITSDDDYDSLRTRYAPQGEYVDFEADGVQTTFELPYQPLDADFDGRIGPREIIIYVKNKPLHVNINAELFLVYSNPIQVGADSLPLFSITPPYTFERKVHYTQVFTVDSLTGAITFGTPPQQGSRVSISGCRTLYDTYDGRECSMQYWDFASRIVIGKTVYGNGCLLGFEKELFLDRDKRQLIYMWQRIELLSTTCPEIAIEYTSWIAVDRPPDGYEVVFVERKSFDW